MDLLSAESEKVRLLQEQSTQIVESARSIATRVGDPIDRIESLLESVKSSTDDLTAPTEDPDKKTAVVSDITSARSTILDSISRLALSNKDSIEALPGAVESVRELIKEEAARYVELLSAESNGIRDRITELNSAVNTLLNRTKEIDEYEQVMFPRIEHQMEQLLAQQSENREILLRILLKMTPFWKSKERKSIKDFIKA